MPKSKVLNLSGWTASVARKDERKFSAENRRKSIIPSKISRYTKSSAGNRSGNGATLTAKRASASDGEARAKLLIKNLARLDELGFKRSKGQRTFHRAFMASCIRKIYGRDVYRNLEKVLREYELDDLRADVIVLSPRRWGKTMGVALFAAAYLCSQPGAEISIYSTGRRASKKLLALIWSMVVKLLGPASIISFNVEELCVRLPDGSATKCSSYPSNATIDEYRKPIALAIGREGEGEGERGPVARPRTNVINPFIFFSTAPKKTIPLPPPSPPPLLGVFQKNERPSPPTHRRVSPPSFSRNPQIRSISS